MPNFHSMWVETGLADLSGAGGDTTTTIDIEAILDALKRDHSKLGARMVAITAPISSSLKRTTIRAHYLSFQEHEPMVLEFVQAIANKLVSFCFSNAHLQASYAAMDGLDNNARQEASNQLFMEAVDLFIKAQKNTKRSGEFGELIAYLLMEWVIGAPQVVAKMSLKTNPEMPVYGSDGIHLKYDAEGDRLLVYFGESKSYEQVTAAIKDAVSSVATALAPEKIRHELMLVKQQFDLAGLPPEAREPILDFLNPLSANAHKRETVAVIFIAFDFKAFSALKALEVDEVAPAFEMALVDALTKHTQTLEDELQAAGIDHRRIETFFLPVPKVADLRLAFHQRIGWKADAA